MGTYGFWHTGGDLPYEMVITHIAGNEWGMHQNAFFENYFGYSMQEKINGKYDFIASGILVWILLFDLLFCWVSRKTRYMLPLMVMAGNWLTLMLATPTAFGVRYVYVMVIGLPLLAAYPWLTGAAAAEKE